MAAPRGGSARRHPLVTIGITLLFLLAFASLTMAVVVTRGDDPDDPAERPDGDVASSAGVTVVMRNDLFDAARIEVAAGTTVTWVNEDPTVHTVNSTDRIFVSENLEQGDRYSFTFETAGTYDYVCIFHAGMAGTILVT